MKWLGSLDLWITFLVICHELARNSSLLVGYDLAWMLALLFSQDVVENFGWFFFSFFSVIGHSRMVSENLGIYTEFGVVFSYTGLWYIRFSLFLRYPGIVSAKWMDASEVFCFCMIGHISILDQALIENQASCCHQYLSIVTLSSIPVYHYIGYINCIKAFRASACCFYSPGGFNKRVFLVT